MPIRPENRTRYPADWRTISAVVRERAGNRCEGSPAYPDCRAENHKPHPITGSLVVLTVAHLDHQPENCANDNLRAWCQRCHNQYDAPTRRAGIRQRAHDSKAIAELFLTGENRMAKTQPDGDKVVQLSNSNSRADTIKRAAQYIEKIEDEIAVLRADLREYKDAHIKGDLGFKLSDWATVYRMYKLEENDRNELLDTIREGFKALGIGEQLDWVTESEKSDKYRA
jgi:5-methylcytosine-specific restriction endonuclease McrA/uncharacterized protein (UPF0335 family)